MEKPKLVAITHDFDASMLVHRAMVPLFMEEIVPIADDESVFVLEGGSRRGTLRPGDEAYEKLYAQISFLNSAGLKPIIHADDGMYHAQPVAVDIQAMQRNLLRSERIGQSVKNKLVFSLVPKTWREMILFIQQGIHSVKLQGRLKDSELKCLMAEHDSFVYRDKCFADQIQTFSSKGHQVFFVGGAMHCINLSAQFDWEVIRYDCSEKTIKNFYIAWYLYYKFVKDYKAKLLK